MVDEGTQQADIARVALGRHPDDDGGETVPGTSGEAVPGTSGEAVPGTSGEAAGEAARPLTRRELRKLREAEEAARTQNATLTWDQPLAPEPTVTGPDVPAGSEPAPQSQTGPDSAPHAQVESSLQAEPAPELVPESVPVHGSGPGTEFHAASVLTSAFDSGTGASDEADASRETSGGHDAEVGRETNGGHDAEVGLDTRPVRAVVPPPPEVPPMSAFNAAVDPAVVRERDVAQVESAPEPVAPRPAASDPVAPEPAAAEPAALEPASPEPAAPAPATPEPAALEPASPEPAAPAPATPEPAAPEPTAPAPAAPAPATPDLAEQPAGFVKTPLGAAPRGGFRGLLYRITGGALNLGPTAAEQAEAELDRRIRRRLDGSRNTAFLSLKGGVGKTSTTVGVGLTLADIRSGSVCAIDANPDAGDLIERALGEGAYESERQLNITRLLRELGESESRVALDAYLHEVGSLRLLAGEQDPELSDSLRADDYRRVYGLVSLHYGVTLTDCGTGVSHPAMHGILEGADNVVVAAGFAVSGAKRARDTLTWLTAHGFGELAANAIVVVTDKDDVSSRVDKEAIEATLAGMCRTLISVPHDTAVADGDLVSLQTVRVETRRAYKEIAAAIVDGYS